MKKCVISEKEIDNIINIILSEEGLKDNKDVNIIVTNRGKYYRDLFIKKKNIFSEDLIIPFLANASNNMKNDILLFIDNITKDCDKEHAVYRLVEVIYHEIRHTQQLSFDKYSYEKFLDGVDKYLRIYKSYYVNHDKYYFEIDASIYSMYKTRGVLKKYYPSVYDRYKVNIEKRIDNYNNDMFLFDSVNKLSDFIGLYKYNKYHFRNDRSLQDISPVFDIFLDRKMNFRNISDIVNDKRFKTLDKRIIYSFFSVDSFLDGINYNSLSEEELSIIMESLKYTRNIYNEQLVGIDKYFDDKKNIVVDYFKKHKSLIKRIDYIYYYLNRYFFSSVYFLNDSINKKRLIKKIDKVIVE